LGPFLVGDPTAAQCTNFRTWRNVVIGQ
jgi:hypothetical protein